MSFWVVFGHACAVDARGGLHATKTPRAKTKRKTWDAACGSRVRLLAFPVDGKPDDRMTVSWPPYVDDAREWGYERCRDCMVAVPGKPQRPPYAKRSKRKSRSR